MAKRTKSLDKEVAKELESALEQNLSEGAGFDWSASMEDMEAQIAAEGNSALLLDGCGNRLAINIANSGGALGYSVRSLGRDGIEGTCCQRVSGTDWDVDAVFENGEWRQVWRVP